MLDVIVCTKCAAKLCVNSPMHTYCTLGAGRGLPARAGSNYYGATMAGLRLIIVNHCHPEMPHVCALRARSFAEAMAKRGNRVILLSGTLCLDKVTLAASKLEEAMLGHDWKVPFRLACPPRRAPLLRRARLGGLPRLCNKAVLASTFVIGDGPFADWVDGSRPYWGVLTTAFRPQAIWGIFGNTGAWTIAREIAKHASVPWVMDLKDGWDHFVPAGVRAWTARRYAGAAAATALSEAHAAEIHSVFGFTAEIVYSGIPAEALEPPARAQDTPTSDIVVSGSLYDAESIDILVAGLDLWLKNKVNGTRPRLRYFGSDGKRLRRAAVGLDQSCEIDIQGYRPLPELFEALRNSRVNLYIRSPRTLFHHKLIELLSCGRPVISIHQESEEARRIAAEIEGRLSGCASPDQLARRLDVAWRSVEFAPPNPKAMSRYTWDAQAEVLEQALERVIF